MPAKSHEKGRSLETAVKFIQQTILESDSALKGTKFSIETNKIVTIAGVRHELDVFIKTLPGSRFESSWVFECKNWNKPVGKNDVIILARKIDAVGTNRGFLVAKRFSKDAHAQAEQDKRLSLVHCTEDFVSPLNFELQHEVVTLGNIEISVRERGVAPSPQPRILDWKTVSFSLYGKPIRLDAFVGEQVNQMIADEKKENAAKYRLEGEHAGRRAGVIEFNPGEFNMGGADVERLVLEFPFRVTVKKVKLLSKFEIKGQGRTFSFEPLDDIIPGKQLKIDIVHRS